MKPNVIYVLPWKLSWFQQMLCEAIQIVHEPMSSGLRSGLDLMPLQTPSATCWYSSQPFRYDELCKSTEYQGTKPNLPSQVIAARWLYDSEIDKQLVMETTGHSSTEGVRTYTRTFETQHQAVSDMQCKEDMHSTLYPSRKPQSSKFVLIQGRSSTTEFSNITSTIIPASFALHSCSSVTININSHTYMYIASCTPTCFTCTLTHYL